MVRQIEDYYLFKGGLEGEWGFLAKFGRHPASDSPILKRTH